MLVQTVIEELQQTFPKKGLRQIVIDAQNFLSQFFSVTEVLRKTATLTSISTYVTLPDDVVRVKKFELQKTNAPAEVTELGWKLQDGQIQFYDTNGVARNLSTEVDALILHYAAKPQDNISELSNDEDINLTGLPVEFHQAVIDGLRELYYAMVPDWNAVNYWKIKNKTWVMEAKKFGNSNQDNTEIQIQNHTI